jgi:hypothetical protein
MSCKQVVPKLLLYWGIHEFTFTSVANPLAAPRWELIASSGLAKIAGSKNGVPPQDRIAR